MKKLKIALRHYSGDQSEQGVALPVAVGMGLIMVLVGTTMIVKSQGDQMTASAQKATGESLSIAEAGVARVQALMNNARPITTTDSNANGTVNLADWRAAAEPYLTAALPEGCTGASADSVNVTPYVEEEEDVDDADGNNSWVKVPNGQFRIHSYTYDNDTSTGTLKIEGQALRNGQPLAIAPLEVTIPITPLASMPVPGLWARNIFNIENNRINGNVQIAGCKTAGGQVSNASGSMSPISSSNYTGQLVVNPHQSFPALPSLPAKTCPDQSAPPTVLDKDGGNCHYPIDALTGSTVPDSDQAKLPRVNASGQIIDSKSPDGNYYYLVNNQDTSSQLSIDSPTLTIDTSSGKVILFLKGNIDMRGSATITHSGTSSNFQIYGSNDTTNYYCSSGPTCITSSIQLEGNKTLNAFIFAPSATAAANGCGDNGCLSGSLWVDSWNASSDTENTVVTQTLNWANLADFKPPQPINPISEWQREAD